MPAMREVQVGDEVICRMSLIGGWRGVVTEIIFDEARVKWNDKTAEPLLVPLGSLTLTPPAPEVPDGQ